jgi:ketosteroid isomerase-like protein
MSVRDELEAINARFSAAMAVPDPEQLGALFTDDAVFLSSGRPTTVGREAILERFRQSFDAPVDVRFECGEVLDGGDIVVDIGTILHDGAESSRYVVVYRRQPDGSLKLAVDVPLPLAGSERSQ